MQVEHLQSGHVGPQYVHDYWSDEETVQSNEIEEIPATARSELDEFNRDSSLVLDCILFAKIGSGAFGRIYKAIDNHTKKIIVVKVQDVSLNEYLLLKEANIHFSLNHKHIPKLHRFYMRNKTFFMHIDFVDGETLLSALRNRGSAERIRMCKTVIPQLLSTLSYLHKNNISHNDIHENNVMITKSGDVQLIDFGLVSKEDASGFEEQDLRSVGQIYCQLMNGEHDEFSLFCCVKNQLKFTRTVK